MTIDEFFGEFSERQYAASIAHLDEHQLRAEHDKVRKKVIAAQSTMAAGGLSALHTAGFSLIGAGMGWRKQNYNSKKQNICEARMCQEGWVPEDMRKRDFLMAVGPSAAAAILVPGADHLAGHLINHAAGHGAAQFTSHHAADTLASAAHHPEQFVRAVSDGVGAQVHAVGQGLVGHATNLVSIDSIAQNTPQFLGNVAGQGLASSAEMAGVHSATRAAANKGATALLSNKEKKRSAGSSWFSKSKSSRASTPQTEIPNTYPANPKSQTSTPRTKVGDDSTSTSPNFLPLADTSELLLFLMAPATNTIAGLPTLWTLTALANIYSLLSNNRSRLSWTWKYLSFPTLIASLSLDEPRMLWAIIAIWQLVISVRLARTYMITPGILMGIALSLSFCFGDACRDFCLGFAGFCFMVAMVQYDFTGQSFDQSSSEYVKWYNLRHCEFVSLFVWFLMENSEMDGNVVSGVQVAAFLISGFQGLGRGWMGFGYLRPLLLVGVLVIELS